MVRQVLLLMAEYGVDDSPLWYRLSNDNVGPADSGELGLSADLRRDLQAWNNVCLSGDGAGANAFELAARVQRELGDDNHVWCGNAGRLDIPANGTTTLVVASDSAGAAIDRRSHRTVSRVAVESAGGRDETARAITRWRRWTNRIGAPFGNAQTRSDGLRAAGSLQTDVGDAAEVVFFAGARSPRDYPVVSTPL